VLCYIQLVIQQLPIETPRWLRNSPTSDDSDDDDTTSMRTTPEFTVRSSILRSKQTMNGVFPPAHGSLIGAAHWVLAMLH
jgi:hypothetical protein